MRKLSPLRRRPQGSTHSRRARRARDHPPQPTAAKLHAIRGRHPQDLRCTPFLLARRRRPRDEAKCVTRYWKVVDQSVCPSLTCRPLRLLCSQPSPHAEPQRFPYEHIKESERVPYAKHLGKGYQRDHHMKANRSKTACDLADARYPTFAGHSASADLAIETMEYARGRCKSVPGSARHEEWNQRQEIYHWADEPARDLSTGPRPRSGRGRGGTPPGQSDFSRRHPAPNTPPPMLEREYSVTVSGADDEITLTKS